MRLTVTTHQQERLQRHQQGRLRLPRWFLQQWAQANAHTAVLVSKVADSALDFALAFASAPEKSSQEFAAHSVGRLSSFPLTFSSCSMLVQRGHLATEELLPTRRKDSR